MDINQAYEFCQFIANKDRNGIIKPSQFNSFAHVAQDDAINRRLRDLDKDQANRDELAPIMVTTEGSSTDKGVLTIPPEYLRYSAGFVIDPITRATLAEIDLLTPSQFGKREMSRLKGPVPEHPVAKMEPGQLQLAPRKEMLVTLTFVKKYQPPNWDYTILDGLARYNDTAIAGETGKVSQGFSLAQTAHNEICFRILQYMGVNLSHETLLQYGLTKEQIS